MAGNNWARGQAFVLVVLREDSSNVRFGLKAKKGRESMIRVRICGGGACENNVPAMHTRCFEQ